MQQGSQAASATGELLPCFPIVWITTLPARFLVAKFGNEGPTRYTMLATNYDGFFLQVFGPLVGILLLGLISFVPAASGHWSALILGIPCALVGLCMTAGFFFDDDPIDSGWIVLAVRGLFAAQLIVGSASIVLWGKQRQGRRKG